MVPCMHAMQAPFEHTGTMSASGVPTNKYYVAYKPITLLCILLMFIEMKFIHCHYCVMFVMKSMSMCND